MVAFRRVITALAVLALFVGLASAQVNPGGAGQQLTCATNVTVTPQLRGEGFTEQTGDITITCTGGSVPVLGNSLPLVNITVFYNTTVTSRLLPISQTANTIQNSSATSEALLLIDEPGSGLTGFGPGLNQTLCTTPLTGCSAWVGNPVQNGVFSPFPGAVAAFPSFSSGVWVASAPAPNVYQGVVSGNSVTFFGVPVMPPTTTGSRVFRITNVRVNAQPLAGGSASGASPVQANISISGATSLSISNSAPNVGYVSPGLTATAGSASGVNQCSSQTKTAVAGILTFSENFGTAFKTRVNAQTNGSYAGQISNLSGGLAQNIPGAIYNSESNFVFPIVGNNGASGATNGVAGLADFGTRLKASFNNIPAGARIFVSTANVNNAAFPITAPSVPGGNLANANTAGTYVGYAQLVSTGSTESISDGNAGTSGFFPAIASTDNGPNNGNVPIAEVSLSNGTGAAVWEVVNTNPNTNESFKFSMYLTYSANVAQNAPLPGTATVNLSYAPTATSGAASATLPIPRFAADSTAARNIFTVNICRTILLYPYITNQAGFDTGLTVANTSQDSFTVGSNVTGAQAGSCAMTYYGGTTAAPTTPPAATNTGSIAAGTVWANTLQTIAPGFQGYMFAVCNFQYAHGFAFISDVGARNLAMGYLAIVIADPGTGSRGANPIGASLSSSGEQGSH
jgi:hypothetical protein